MHHATTSLCSSWDSVGLSPVVPTGTRPFVPSEICHSTSPRNAFWSTEPFWNGVTSAVNDPLKLVFAVMDQSSLQSGGNACRHKTAHPRTGRCYLYGAIHILISGRG